MQEDPTGSAGGSDAELITRVRSGDRTAFGILYSRHASAATNLARQFARSPSEVDDLVSESFARVLDALLGGRGPDTAFRAYLFTTLRNTAFDRSRKDSKLQFTDDVAAHETPEVADDPVVLELENTLVAKAYAALPERWQTVLWHTQVEGQSAAEVGVLLGMTANAVTSLAFRAREGLREAYLQAHLADTAAERCRATVDRLGGWARGGLSRREQAQVDTHLAECDRCRALAAELSEINTGLRGLLAPLLLGGAAAGYLATTSTGVAVPLVAAGAAGGGAAVGAGAAAAGGSGSSGGGVLSFLARPWTLAAAGTGVVAAAVVAVVIAVSSSGDKQPLAGGPPVVTPVTSSAVTSSPPVTTSSPAPPSSAVSSGQQQSVAPPATPSTRRTTSRSSTAPTTPTTKAGSSSDSTSTPVGPPVIYSTHQVTPSGTPPTTTAPSTTAATSGPPVTPSTTASSSVPPVTSSTTAPSTTPPTTTPGPTTTTPPSTTPSTIESTPAKPATLSDPVFVSADLEATAGAPTTVSFSVENSGDVPSDLQTVHVDPPIGVMVTGGSGTVPSGAQGLRRASAFLAPPAAEPTAPDKSVPVTCDSATAGTECTYTVPAHATLTVTLALDVSPAAVDGDLTVTAPGAHPVSLPVTVSPGLTALQLEPPSGWTIGAAAPAHLTGTAAPGVSKIGTITLPMHGVDIWLAVGDNSGPCHANTKTLTLTCTASAGPDGTVDYGTLLATPVLPGDLSLTATLPGVGRALTFSGPGETALSADPPSTSSGPVELTGPFNGAIVGSAAEYCPRPDLRTWPNSCVYDPNSWQQLNEPVSLPEALHDHAAISAQLTWAVSETTARAPSSISLQIGEDNPIPVDGQPIRLAQAAGNIDSTMIQYSAALPDPDVLSDQQTISVTGLLPTDKDEFPNMAAWTLTIIWSDPDAQATVSVYSQPALLTPGASWTEPTELNGPVERVAAALWGTDNAGNKEITAGGTTVASSDDGQCPTLMGLVSQPTDAQASGNGDSDCASVGFSLLDTDVESNPEGPVIIGTTDDTVWVGIVLVTRSGPGEEATPPPP